MDNKYKQLKKQVDKILRDQFGKAATVILISEENNTESYQKLSKLLYKDSGNVYYLIVNKNLAENEKAKQLFLQEGSALFIAIDKLKKDINETK